MNILSFFTHEGWESNWAKTGHDFFMLNSPERQNGWKHSERKMPENYNPIDFDEAENMCSSKGVDIIVNHSAFEQRFIAEHLSIDYDIPQIEMNHCLPLRSWTLENIATLKAKNVAAGATVFTTQYQADRWGYGLEGIICGHTVDTGAFKPDYTGQNPTIMSVAYDFKERADILGYDDWKFLTNGLSHIHYGNGEGETLASASDLATSFCLNRVFLNTAKESTLPTSMLEAMACGMPVVTVAANAFTNDVFTNGFNGFVSSDMFELKNYLGKLLNNRELSAKIGMNGHNTFCEKFAPKLFIDKWNEIFCLTKGKNANK